MNIMMWIVLFGMLFNLTVGVWLIRTKEAELGLWLLGIAIMSTPLFMWELLS